MRTIRKLIFAVILVAMLVVPISAQISAQNGEDPLKPVTTPSPTLTDSDTIVPDAQLSTFLYLPVVAGGNLDSVQSGLLEIVELDVELTIGAEVVIDTTNKTISSDDILADQQAPPPPGMEVPDVETIVKEQGPDSVYLDSTIVEPSAANSWSTIMAEGFEGTFPPSDPKWQVFDNDEQPITNGEYFWDDSSFKPRTGSSSAWPARGGANALNPARSNYQNNMRSWMVYGPFDLSDAADAELRFSYWNQSEAGPDTLSWVASVDGITFKGNSVSGDSGGWRSVNYSLKYVTGLRKVWIGFIFISDESLTRKGPFIDDISLRKFVGTTDADDNRTLSSGQKLNGTITPVTDEDTYYFEATQGQRVTIRMNKAAGSRLNSFLMLYAPDDSKVAWDDDSGGNQNSLINQVSLPLTGRYRIVARSYNNNRANSGAYTLSLNLEKENK
jgi:hypothetical protein